MSSQNSCSSPNFSCANSSRGAHGQSLRPAQRRSRAERHADLRLAAGRQFDHAGKTGGAAAIVLRAQIGMAVERDEGNARIGARVFPRIFARKNLQQSASSEVETKAQLWTNSLRGLAK